MAQKSLDRKTPVRNFDPRLIRKGYIYTAKDIATVFNISESVVHRWVREEGLIPIDDKKPAMFHFEVLKQFLTYKTQARKMAKGNAGDLACLKCFLKQRAYNDEVIIKKTNPKFWLLQAICSSCGSKMNMSVPKNEELITITWGYQQVETLPILSIKDSSTPTTRITGRKGKIKAKFKYEGGLNFYPDNERIKHQYYERILYSFGKDQKTLATLIAAIRLFEESNKFKDFKTFDYEQGKAFQQFVLKKYSNSPQMAHRVITSVREFFSWLKDQAGYKKLNDDDIQVLRLPLKDREKARASKPKDYLDVEEWQELILSLEPKNYTELRNRAFLACLLLTAMRIEALISLQIGDVNLAHDYVYQDPKHVRTKFSSAHKTNFWKFKPEIKQIIVAWIEQLKRDYGFTDSSPLFPKIQVTANSNMEFEAIGFVDEPMGSASIIRQELTKQLKQANLGHYTPHTIRNSVVAAFMELGLDSEQLKAVSQNMSHKNLNTTVNNYYQVNEFRKDQIISEIDIVKKREQLKLKNNPKYQFIMSQLNSEDMVNKLFECIVKTN